MLRCASRVNWSLRGQQARGGGGGGGALPGAWGQSWDTSPSRSISVSLCPARNPARTRGYLQGQKEFADDGSWGQGTWREQLKCWRLCDPAGPLCASISSSVKWGLNSTSAAY